MKKVLGIIIEYNPFHNGHFYHIQKAKEMTGCDYVIGVMSGNFVQRGEPAIINKWARSEIALNCGVDLVVELPTNFAIQSAEGFALGSVHLLAKTGVVTDLTFGSEAGEISPLLKTATDLLNLEKNPQAIKEHLKGGIPYNNALAELVNSPKVLSGSNNILGLEYIKTILKYNLALEVSTIKRVKSEYNEKQLPIGDIASATALRPHIQRNQVESLRKYVPSKSFSILSETLSTIQKPGNINAFTDLFFGLVYRQGTSDIKNLHRMETGLENRIFNTCNQASDLDVFLDLAKTKRYSKSRISRLVMQFILGLNSDLIERANEDPGAYLRILGCSTKGLTLLKDIKNHSSVPYSLNFTKLVQSFSHDSLGKELLDFETRASNIYTKFFYRKAVHQLEYLKESVILKN